MKKLYCIAITILVTGVIWGGQILMTHGHAKGGWQGFGLGFEDSAINVKEKEIKIHVNWERATWGIGMFHTLPQPINGKNIRAVRIKAKTEKGSQTKIYTGVATKDDASMEILRKKALPLTDQWQNFEFPISEMVISKPEATSRSFAESDWEKIQIFKLLLAKPEQGQVMRDVIMIRSPELIMMNE
jgi:hypothetical protein